MAASRDAFREGEIPASLLVGHASENTGLNGEWTLIADHRSDGMREITEFFGLDPHDRTAWEFSQHLNAPRMRLEYKKNEEGIPQLTVVCHGALSGDCPRAIIFDGHEQQGFKINKLVPHAPLQHMSSGFEEGSFLAAEIEGILFVRYKMRKGTFYITRVLLKEDPEGKEEGPLTLAQYCVITDDGKKHVALRYHKRI
ncbi:hypothetical protein Efla_004760 [Eimeria flavescens]